MSHFEFGSEYEVDREIVDVFESDAYARAVQAWSAAAKSQGATATVGSASQARAHGCCAGCSGSPSAPPPRAASPLAAALTSVKTTLAHRELPGALGRVPRPARARAASAVVVVASLCTTTPMTSAPQSTPGASSPSSTPYERMRARERGGHGLR
ncbi:hypothetical protein DFH11DRAFT_1566508, partial [Phellopilus nigrolimitatus]